MRFRRGICSCIVMILAACSGGPESTAPGSDDSRERLQKTIPLVMADGILARMVREDGIGRLASRSAQDVVVYWPGSDPLIGFQSVEYALSQSDWSAGSQFFWQPLLLRMAPGLGLVAGVLTASGDVTGGDLEMGRYLAAWHFEEDRADLSAFAITQVPVRATIAAPAASLANGAADSLPDAIRNADRAFRNRLSSDGPAVAFPTWYAPDGLGFGSGGPLAVGPKGMAAQLATTSPGTRWVMTPGAWGVSTDHSLAWVGGELVISADLGQAQRWNYLLFWEKQPDGEYRIIAAITNPRERVT